MKRITLGAVSLAALAIVGVAQAQDPTPPPPARPAPVVAAPAPRAPSRATAPTPAMAPRAIDMFDLDAVRDAQREVQREAVRMNRESIDMARDMARETSRMDRDLSEMAREMPRMQRDMEEGMRIAQQDFKVRALDMSAMTPMAPMPPMGTMPAMAPMADLAPLAKSFGEGFSYGFGGSASISGGERFHMPPAPWAQDDPADSIYKQARNALNAGEYGRAAKLFADISKNYPKSAYQTDARYYEAVARYRIGSTDELKQAAKLLEPIASKSTTATGSTTIRSANFVDYRRNASEGDVSALYFRINGQLAQRGDRDAAAIVQKAASTPGASCDQDDIDVRTQALNALSQMDPQGATPAIRHVLDSKDDCSAPLRRSAVFMLGRRGDAESSTMLMQVAKSDPNVNVRTEAINYLSRIPGDVGLNALEDMLRNEQDERIQRAAVHALMSSDNAKARASMRSLIDRKDAPLMLRVEAVNSFNSERATQDDAKYLRDLYNRADNDRLKQSIIGAVSRIGGSENDQWVMAIARNQNEPSLMRSIALGQLSRSSIPITDLSKLYDTADSYDLRNRVINILSSRKEPEATDKLIEIVKTSTVVPLRTQAINALTRKNDPRATQLLMDILDGKRS